MFTNIFEKLKECSLDIKEIKYLIEINCSDTELFKKYKLCEEISGKKILNRVENFIVSCWSAKDWLKKDILQKKGNNISQQFEAGLYNYDSVQMIQYLADSIKHAEIDKQHLIKNKYKTREPKLADIFLRLTNNAVPGPLKPIYESRGNSVPPFQIDQVVFYTNGEYHYNFDTIVLSILIIDKNGQEIGHIIDYIERYIDEILFEYKKY